MKRTLALFFVTIIISLIFGCVKEPVISNDKNYIVNFQDVFFDVDTTFVDLGKLAAYISGDTIIVSMEMKEIPSTLTYNQTELQENHLNYKWEVIFDLDNSNNRSEGDISFSIMKFKPPVSEGEKVAPILDFTQKDIWVREISSSSNKGTINNIRIENNNIIIKVLTSQYNDLKKINTNTNVIFETLFNNGIKSYTDKYPN